MEGRQSVLSILGGRSLGMSPGKESSMMSGSTPERKLRMKGELRGVVKMVMREARRRWWRR